jgi:hypothetical protein
MTRVVDQTGLHPKGETHSVVQGSAARRVRSVEPPWVVSNLRASFPSRSKILRFQESIDTRAPWDAV